MPQKLRELLKLTEMAKKASVSMQRKLALYWFFMAAAVFGTLLLILSVTGVLSNADREIGQTMRLQLQNTAANISSQIESLSAHGIALSERAGRELMQTLSAYGSNVSALNDEPEALLSLQHSFYDMLYTTLKASSASGAFIVLDATTNTKAEAAETSRSGLYIRYVNLSTNKSMNQQVIYFRGIPDIAREEELELHNRWNLEFNSSNIPGYDEMMQTPVRRLADAYRWTDRLHLTDTWEDVMLLCVPVLDSGGKAAGICGIEISSLYFSFCYPAFDSSVGSMVSVLAPVENGQLLLEQGLIGGTESTYLNGSSVMHIDEGRYFNTYSSNAGNYIGVSRVIPFLSQDGRTWTVSVLLPQDGYAAYAYRNRMVWIISSLAFFLVMLGCAIFLSRRFTRPIVGSIAAVQSGAAVENVSSSGISEIDALMAFVKSTKQDQTLSEGKLPPNIAELFDTFAARAATLTEAERGVLKHYIDGREISEIPRIAYISINTVRKHNRNIYEKLGVTSRDELMLYIELFRRCNRLDELT